MEISIKGYINDFKSIIGEFNGKMCVSGNLDPYWDLVKASDKALQEKYSGIINTGRKYAKFVSSMESLITPRANTS